MSKIAEGKGKAQLLSKIFEPGQGNKINLSLAMSTRYWTAASRTPW
jgi:hypothetical protein